MTKYTPSIDFGTRLIVAPSVLSRSAGDETVLLESRREQFYGLEGVGTHVFALLHGAPTLGDIVDSVVHEYGVERCRAEQDVKSLASEMLVEGLVEVIDS